MSKNVKVLAVVDYIGESPNATPYTRMQALCANYNTVIMLRKNMYLATEQLAIEEKVVLNIKNLIKLATKYKFDVIYTAGIHNYALAYFLKIINHAVLVIDIFDDVTLGKNTLKKLQGLKNRIKYCIFCFAYFWGIQVIKYADIVYLTLSEKILSYYPKRNKGYIHLFNGIHEELIVNGIYDKPKDQISEDKKVEISYVGYIGRNRGIYKILEVANKLKSEKEVHLNLIGPIIKNEKHEIEKYITDHKLKNITLYGFMSYDDVLKTLKSTSIALFIFPTGKRELDYIYPIKIFEYLSFNLDIIATKGYGISEIKMDFSDNIHIVEYDSNIIYQAIINILRKGKKTGVCMDNLFKYTWKKINAKFIRYIDLAVKGKYNA